MAGPAPYPLEIYQGDTFELPIRLREVSSGGVLGDYLDLTGSTLKAQIRGTEAGSVLAEFAVTVEDQTSVATKGRATLTLIHDVTLLLTDAATALWDMQVTDSGGKVRTLLRGEVTITGEISR